MNSEGIKKGGSLFSASAARTSIFISVLAMHAAAAAARHSLNVPFFLLVFFPIRQVFLHVFAWGTCFPDLPSVFSREKKALFSHLFRKSPHFSPLPTQPTAFPFMNRGVIDSNLLTPNSAHLFLPAAAVHAHLSPKKTPNGSCCR